MGNPIYSDTTPEKQFERIKLARRETNYFSALNSFQASSLSNRATPYESYASAAAASMRTTRRTVFSQHQYRQQEGMRTEDAMVVGGDPNEHPLRAILQQESGLHHYDTSTVNSATTTAGRRGGVRSSQMNIPSSNRLYIDSANDLEEIIMRQLRPRSFPLLLEHAATVSASPLALSDNATPIISEESNGFESVGNGSGNDFLITPTDYQTMETVMGRLRRQMRNSTTRMAQEAALLHRPSESTSTVSTIRNSTMTTTWPTLRAEIDESATTRSTSITRSAGYNPRDQLERVRRTRQERYRNIPQSDFHQAFFRWTSSSRQTVTPEGPERQVEGEEEEERDELLNIFETTRPALLGTRRRVDNREALDRRLESLIRARPT